uniref:Uncharacterized protein n=1 Tax=Candidatus Methanophaga sp. ANME-1 ERB7 TaxID=2759913 RepID=A0A7G9Z360_9EURY|nr:hypothetical protein MMBIEIEP_00042 [Methanosarcinales archaeon ANME-1 ERB7]
MIRKEMKKQKVIVLFAIALLLAVVVGGMQTVAAVVEAVMDVTTYENTIEQPIDVGKIRFISNAVDNNWVKGTKFAGSPMEIMYWEKETKYLIDIHLNDSGYIDDVSFRRWGNGITEIPYALASQSLAKLPVATTSVLITEAVYKDMINDKGPVDTSKIQYVGNARHREWVIGSKPKVTNSIGSGKPSTGVIGAPIAHGNTLIYWDKYTKWVITLKLDSEGNVNFVDFGLNGNRAVKVIPPSLAEEALSKLPIVGTKAPITTEP